MLTRQRHQIICDELAAKGQVTSGELASRLAVSEDTIRRDLRTLAKAGECRRVYGGAVAPYAGPISARKDHLAEEKSRLAMTAAGQLRPGQTVLIDAGSTNAAIAAAIPANLPLTVATNSVDVATALSDRGQITLIMLGGTLDRDSGALIGPDTARAVDRIAADIVFLGTCGIDAAHGITAFDPVEVAIKQAMVAASARVIVAATTEKLGTAAPYRVAGLDRIDDLIVSRTAERQTRSFAAANIAVHLA